MGGAGWAGIGLRQRREPLTKLIDQNKTVESIAHTAIETLNPRDRVSNDENSIIEHWYNNYFIVYGYQQVKNNYVTSRNNKYVFYINKMAYF